MEIFLRWCIAIVAQPILAFVLICCINAAWYIGDEITHTVRNMKRDIKNSLWEIEWKLKLLKGR